MNLPELEATLANAGCRPRAGNALCPSHEDRNPSLSYAEGREGRLLVRCQAGCPTETVVAALGLTMADLFADDRKVMTMPKPSKRTTKPTVAPTYSRPVLDAETEAGRVAQALHNAGHDAAPKVVAALAKGDEAEADRLLARAEALYRLADRLIIQEYHGEGKEGVTDPAYWSVEQVLGLWGPENLGDLLARLVSSPALRRALESTEDPTNEVLAQALTGGLDVNTHEEAK